MQKFIENFDVPASVMLQVAGLICENQLTHAIIETDEDEKIITMEVEYKKEERAVIHQIEDLIADNSDDDEDEEEDDEE